MHTEKSAAPPPSLLAMPSDHPPCVCETSGCLASTDLRCGGCGVAPFCSEACAAAGWAAHAAACRETVEARGARWVVSPLAPVAPAKRLRRVDVSFAAACDDALAPPATLLSAIAPQLLAFFDTRNVLPLRASCTEARAAVAAAPWRDAATRIRGSVAAWRACFPAARAAGLMHWHTDADFVHLRGIHTLSADHNQNITNAAFEHLAGIHTLSTGSCDRITDAAFAHIRGVHTLDMSLCHGITDAAFVHLRGIHTLKMRFCRHITDAAFTHLRGIHTLDMSHCDQPTITGAAFAHLDGIHTLNMAYCRQRTITDATIASLRDRIHTLDASQRRPGRAERRLERDQERWLAAMLDEGIQEFITQSIQQDLFRSQARDLDW